MEIKIIRKWFSLKTVISEFLIPEVDFKVYCLEDVPRAEGVKIYGETAIPAGSYMMRVTWSPKYKRNLPLIYNSPDMSINMHGKRWTGVRIHKGNWMQDTDACILPGMNKGNDAVWSSGKAMKLIDDIIDFDDTDTVHRIHIINQQAA